jgi:hypothetical protein
LYWWPDDGCKWTKQVAASKYRTVFVLSGWKPLVLNVSQPQ